jgi:hypothetical protein
MERWSASTTRSTSNAASKPRGRATRPQQIIVTYASIFRAPSHCANQKPSRPASNATTMRVTVYRPRRLRRASDTAAKAEPLGRALLTATAKDLPSRTRLLPGGKGSEYASPTDPCCCRACDHCLIKVPRRSFSHGQQRTEYFFLTNNLFTPRPHVAVDATPRARKRASRSGRASSHRRSRSCRRENHPGCVA